MKKRVYLGLLFALLYGLDRLSKCLVSTVPPGSVLARFDPVLRLVYVRNTGAAFGILSGQTLVLAAVGIAAAGLLLCLPRVMRVTPAVRGLRVMLAAGLAGNLTDRLVYGYVIDFIEPVFMRFAVFNVADILIVVSTIALAMMLLTDKPQ